MDRSEPLIPVGGTSRESRGPDRFSTILLPSVIASLAALNFGFTLGYTSPTQKALTKDLKLNNTQFSWFGSLIGVGAIIGSVVAGSIIDFLGRKGTILSTALLYTPGWCLISYPSNVVMLYIGRIFLGVAAGFSSLAVPLYIAEIASPKYRGGLGSINQLAITIGIFLAYLVGDFVSWQWTAIFGVVLVSFMTLLMLFMPETPRWLLATGKKGKAIEQLRWLRGPNYDVEEECYEIESNLDHQEHVSFKEFFMPSLYKPLIIGSMLMVFQQFSGVNAILFYDSKIFSSAGFTDSDEVSLSVGASQVVATAIGCLIVDRTGRKKLLFIGGIVMGVTLFLLGMYYDLASINNKEAKKVSIFGKYSHTVPEDHISWMAILSVVIFIVMFSIGWGPLPWVLMSEIFPPRARGLGCGIVTLVNWSLVFAITRTFDQMTKSLSQQGTFWLFAFSSFMSVLYTLCFVPETKGKSLEEIELVFNRGARSREELSQT